MISLPTEKLILGILTGLKSVERKNKKPSFPMEPSFAVNYFNVLILFKKNDSFKIVK